jgi:two-component system, OmpR family, copper resistance phosphate regulon response regulator CusR
MKILLIEDEPKVAGFIKKGLEEQSHMVSIASDGLSGKRMALEEEFELIILDLNLPKLNGIEVCKAIREKHKSLPILMLTALGTIENKVEGLDSGADDYLVKPFEFIELLARIRALSRRNNDYIKSEIYSVLDLELDTGSKMVRRNGINISLTSKEFDLLEYLIKNKGKVVSRRDIAEKVWDVSFDTGTNIIDVYINYLRKKVDRDFSVKLIYTLVGKGYVLKGNEYENKR